MRSRNDIADDFRGTCANHSNDKDFTFLVAHGVTIEILLDIRDLLLKQQQEVDVAVDHLVKIAIDAAEGETNG